MAIKNLIPPAVPHYGIPLYAIPTGDLVYASLSLSVYHGAQLVPNPYTLDVRSGGYRFPYPQTGIYQFSLKNEESVECTITGFSVAGDLEVFDQQFSVGSTLAAGESVDFYIETIPAALRGLQNAEGLITITNTFIGQIGDEIHNIIIEYATSRDLDAVRRSKYPTPLDGRLRPDTYVDEFSNNLNRTVDDPQQQTRPGGKPNGF